LRLSVLLSPSNRGVHIFFVLFSIILGTETIERLNGDTYDNPNERHFTTEKEEAIIKRRARFFVGYREYAYLFIYVKEQIKLIETVKLQKEIVAASVLLMLLRFSSSQSSSFPSFAPQPKC